MKTRYPFEDSQFDQRWDASVGASDIAWISAEGSLAKARGSSAFVSRLKEDGKTGDCG
jgi:hypothetical protein